MFLDLRLVAVEEVDVGREQQFGDLAEVAVLCYVRPVLNVVFDAVEYQLL
jgi:hypothetical protein